MNAKGCDTVGNIPHFSDYRRLESGQLSKGYTSPTACLQRTIQEGVKRFFISTVGCHSELMNPPQKRRESLSPGLPWGGWAPSQIDGAEWQPERHRAIWGSVASACRRK